MRKLIFLLLLFIPFLLKGATYYIDPGGNDDTGDGSSGKPWYRLSYAASQVGSDNTIYVNSGSYTDNNRVVLAIRVNILGNSSNIPNITTSYVSSSNSNAYIYLYSSSLTNGDQTISYININGNNLTATRGIWVGYRYNVIIHHCTISNFAATGVHYRNQIGWTQPPVTYASGNDFYNNTVTNCSDRHYSSLDPGNLRIDGQEEMEIYNCIFTNNERSPGYNGNSLNITNCRGITMHDCDFTRNDREGLPSDSYGRWNFFSEIFHLQGGVEFYDNTFIGAAKLDFSNADNGSSTKGSYPFTISVHDNTFTTTTGNQISYYSPTQVGHTNAAIEVEKGTYNYVYIYNNYIKSNPRGIAFTTAGTYNQSFTYFYIYNNVLDNIGYTDYTSTWGMLVDLAANGGYSVTLDNFHIRNNTFYGGSGYNYNGIRWTANGTFTNSTIQNNIFHSWDNYPIYFGIQVGESASFTDIDVTYNDFYNNGYNIVYISGSITQVRVDLSTGNITSNPLFVSTTNLHLQEGSPVISEGTVAYSNYDYDGVPWDTPSTATMGAYEFVGEENIYYVDEDGVDDPGRDGSASEPWATLGYACTRATTVGDKIHINAGAYSQATQCILENGVIIEGAGKSVVTITSTFTGSSSEAMIEAETDEGWLYGEGNQSISGITFNGNGSSTYMCISINYRHNVIIHDCDFNNFYYKGVYFNGQHSSSWTATNIFEPDEVMPSYWSNGNQIYSCVFTNCGLLSGTSGHGNLEFNTQNGFLCHDVIITQTARAWGSNGYGIKMVTGFNRGFKIYDCDITVDERPTGSYNFAIECWYNMDECEIHDNTIVGEIDVTGTHKRATNYGTWIHDNTTGFSSTQDHFERGINLEAYINGIIINNNLIKYVSQGIIYSFIWPQYAYGHDYPSYYRDIWIYDNLIVNLGENGSGYTRGSIYGIGSTSWSQYDINTIEDVYIYNNTITSIDVTKSGVYVGTGMFLPSGVTTDNYNIRNNIIVGFDYGSYQAPIIGWGETDNTNVRITNNLFYGNGNSNVPLYTEDTGDHGDYVPGTGYTYSDNWEGYNPNFVSSSDWHLLETSPAIGEGYTPVSDYDYDYEPWDDPPAIGAYEFIGEPSGGIKYYVKNGGNDSYTGTSDALAWETVGKVNNFTFLESDSVFFKRGSIWREALIPNSGTSSYYMYYGAYDTGNKPLFLGSKEENSTGDWSEVLTNIWQNSDATFTVDVGNLIFNGEASCGVKIMSATPTLDAQGEFWYDHVNNRIRLYSTSNPATYYTDIECALYKYGLTSMSGKQYVTFQNLDFRYWGACLWAYGGNYINFYDLDISYIGGVDQNSDYSVRFGNGLQMWEGIRDITIERCKVDNIYDAGLSAQGYTGTYTAQNLVLRNNIISNCEYGFEFYFRPETATAQNIYFEHNTIVNSGGGFGHYQRTDGVTGQAIRIYNFTATRSNVNIRNNIFYNATERLFSIGSLSDLTNITLDYNCYYTTTGYIGRIGSTNYSSLSTWQAAISQEANAIGEDPEFVSGSDFHLQETSPVIGEGLTVSGVIYDFDLEEWEDPPAMGVYEGEEEEEPPPVNTVGTFGGTVGTYNGKRATIIIP